MEQTISTKDTIKPVIMKTKRNIFSSFFQYLKIKSSKLIKRLDVEKISFDRLSDVQQKAINVASVCIFNKDSKLYSDPKTGLIQIELPEIFIAVTQEGGHYEVNFVYINQPVPTCYKVGFDISSVNHIYTKFERETVNRMEDNIKRRDVVINNNFDHLSEAVKALSLQKEDTGK